MASRAAIPLAVFLMLLFTAPATASAGVRSFKPVRATESALTFKLRGLEPAAVRHARLRAGGVRRTVSLRTIRRAARHGVLRVRRGSLGPRIARAGIARAASASLTVTTCTTSSSSYAAAIAGTPGLVSHWRLGETAGSVACDQAQRNAGTYGTGVALGQAGAIADGDRAAGFNGATRVAVASSTSLAPGAGVSVEAWIKPTSTASQTVARKHGQYLLRISSGRVVARVWLASGSYVELATPAVVQTSVFQHVAMTYDRSTLRVYRNGTQIAAKSAAGTPAGSRKALLVGSSDGYDGFRGALDEVAVYSRALTAEQVAARISAATSNDGAPSTPGDADPTPDGGSADPLPTPTVWRRSASFESDLISGTDGWNLPPMSQVSGFAISRTSEVGGATGSYAAKIVSSGGNTGCSCPRMWFQDSYTRYTAGHELWLRGSWYFPNPSAITWSRMMNLSSYTGNTAADYYTGLVIEGGSGQMLVRSRNYHSTTGQKLIFPARPIPVGRWFTVVLHLKLSPTDGQALNEWYLDGQLVGSNTLANMWGSQAINVFQAGMPYFLNGINSTVYFDNPGLKD